MPTTEDRVEKLEKKYSGVRNEAFFSKCPFDVTNVKPGMFEGQLLSFDLQLRVRPSDLHSDPGYFTIKGCSLRKSKAGDSNWIAFPGKKTGAGNWFNFVEASGRLLDDIHNQLNQLLVELKENGQ